MKKQQTAKKHCKKHATTTKKYGTHRMCLHEHNGSINQKMYNFMYRYICLEVMWIEAVNLHKVYNRKITFTDSTNYRIFYVQNASYS